MICDMVFVRSVIIPVIILLFLTDVTLQSLPPYHPTEDVQYMITYSIWDDPNAKTRNSQYVTINGTSGETDENLCDANFNVVNQDVLCVFQSDVNIGDYTCVSLRTGGSDGLDLTEVKVEIDGTETHTIVPQGDAEYIGLDNGETKEFCVELGTWSKYPGKYLSGYSSGVSKYDTLQAAKAGCIQRIDCGGITYEPYSGKFTIRRGGYLRNSLSEEISWMLISGDGEECPAGTYRNSDMTFCARLCDVYTISAAGASSCTTCVAGTVANADKTTCEECPAGTYRNSDMTSCASCAVNNISTAGASSCTACDAGAVANADKTTCEECSAGTYRNSDMSSCTSCDRNTISIAGASSCTTCDAGTMDNEDKTECEECSAGKYRASYMNDCKRCFENSISAAGASSCTICGDGKVANEDQTKCGKCRAGKYRNSRDMDVCKQCDKNTISAAGASSCTACGDGKVANEDQTKCDECQAGTFRSSDMQTCQRCQGNTISMNRAVKCTKCSEGTVANEDNTDCGCALGWYSANGGQPPCRTCEASDNCKSDITDNLDNIMEAVKSGNVEVVTEGLEEITDSGLVLSPENARELLQTLSSSKRLLENASQNVEELSVAIVESIGLVKHCEPEYLSENEKSEIIEIIEAASITLKEGRNITTSSIVAQSIVSKEEEVELSAPEAIPQADRPIKLNFGSHRGQRATVAVIDESYKDILPQPQGHKATLGSPIVSVNFVDSQKQTGDSTSFSLIFQRKEHPELLGSNIERKCVYLNTTTDQWLTNGCTTLLNRDRTCTCTCSHTTSFAVLLSPTQITDHQTQEIVSYIMFVINLVFLSLTFCLIAPFKKLREKQMVMIQLSLIVTLILGYISFISLSASSNITVDEYGNPLLSLNAGCVAGVIISQYFFLSAFFWMGCTAWTFFNKIARAVKTYGKTDKYYFHKCAIISWICPIIFPVAALLFSLIPNRGDHAMPYVGAKRENGKRNCWVEDPWRFIGFLVPAYLILLFNCVCFGMVAKVIIRSKKPGGGDTELVKTAKAMMVVAVSVGIPWIVAGLAFGPGANFMQYLFIVLTGLQGPLLFLALIMFQDDAKANTLKLLKMWFTRKETATLIQKHQETATNTYSTSPSHKPETCKIGVVIEREEQIYAEIYEKRNEQIGSEEQIYVEIQEVDI